MPKLNLNWYKQDIEYDSSITKQEENDIIEYINKYDDYDQIFANDVRVPIFTNLSDIRKNILNWYPFNKDVNVLEIGSEFGSITGMLCDKCESVTSVEFIKKRAEAVIKRHEDKSNLEVICGSLKDISFDKKFDYITLIGISEYANTIMNSNNGLQELLIFCKSLLKDNGVILLAIDNKFGVKYLVGDINSVNDYSISNMNVNSLNKYTMYGKNELENIFKKLNVVNYNFYYPLPDYRLANVIYSDKYLPKENDSKMMYNRYYNNTERVYSNELLMYKEILKNNIFDIFANSFLVEISNSNNNLPKYISYNNIRKKEYRLCSKIYDEYVIKENTNNESIRHINTIKNNIEMLNELNFNIIDIYENGNIKSKFIENETLDKYICNLILSERKQDALDVIEKWYKYIFNKFEFKYNSEDNCFTENNIETDEELLKKLNFIENGFIDLVFENTFYLDNTFVFYDQEWYMKNIPIEYILFRAINNIFSYNPEIEKIVNKDEVLNIFGIKCFEQMFKGLEYKLQMSIIDKYMYNFYASQDVEINNNIQVNQNNICIYKENKKLINELEFIKTNTSNISKVLNEKLTVLNNDIIEKESKIESLNDLLSKNNEKIELLEKKLDKIYSSRYWKYTKGLRKLEKMLKKDV